MKNISLTLLVFTLVLSSCKYEEGPGISLISKRDRISNEWSVISYKIDGNENDSALKSFKSGDSLETLLCITRSGYFSTNPQYTREFSKANNNKTYAYNPRSIDLYSNLKNNYFAKNALVNSGRWAFHQKHNNVHFGNNGNSDLSEARNTDVLKCEIIQLKNKELKFSFVSLDGKKHLLTFEAWNYETPKQRAKNK